MLLLVLVNSAESIKNYQGMVLGQDFFLDLALAEAGGLVSDDLGDQFLCRWGQCGHISFLKFLV